MSRGRSKRTLRKFVNEAVTVRSRSGVVGVIKEEVWRNEKQHVVKYNLAYINHTICTADNGRVLGYDNAHGFHERHFMGTSEGVAFTTYEALLQSFLAEVRVWREQT